MGESEKTSRKMGRGGWRRGKGGGDQGARKGRMRELEAPRAEAGARAGRGPYFALHLDDAVGTACWSPLWPGHGGAGQAGDDAPDRPPRRRCTAPPVARTAPPSYPNRDVKGAATQKGKRSPRFLGNGEGVAESLRLLTSLRYGPSVPEV